MSSISEHILGINGWTEKANRHIETITSQLSDIETLLENKIPEDDINLLEILELIDYIQVQHKSFINNITSKNHTINEMKDDLQHQLKILNHTFKLLQIEAGNISS